jgi:hypothetical protein
MSSICTTAVASTGKAVVDRHQRVALACTSRRFPAHMRAIEIGAGLLLICGLALASCALPVLF